MSFSAHVSSLLEHLTKPKRLQKKKRNKLKQNERKKREAIRAGKRKAYYTRGTCTGLCKTTDLPPEEALRAKCRLTEDYWTDLSVRLHLY